ncbi:hypothetical protein HMPREF2531_01398, partial [Bacteroides intestinalis]
VFYLHNQMDSPILGEFCPKFALTLPYLDLTVFRQIKDENNRL